MTSRIVILAARNTIHQTPDVARDGRESSMTKWTLTQAEADALLGLPKKAVTDDVHEVPAAGGKLTVPLVSHDGREEFLLDLYRGRVSAIKQLPRLSPCSVKQFPRGGVK